MKSHTSTLILIFLTTCMWVVYFVALYAVYTLKSTRVMSTAVAVPAEVQIKTARLHDKINDLYLTHDNAAQIFDLLERLARQHAVTVTVDSVSNPQSSLKELVKAISFIEIKVTLIGTWESSIHLLHDIEVLPLVARITDAEVSESLDAQQPKVVATLRFYVRNPLK